MRCKLILRIAENILMNPGNDKFMHVNRTGERVKTLIMELRGTVELMVEVSFFHPGIRTRRFWFTLDGIFCQGEYQTAKFNSTWVERKLIHAQVQGPRTVASVQPKTHRETPYWHQLFKGNTEHRDKQEWWRRAWATSTGHKRKGRKD